MSAVGGATPSSAHHSVYAHHTAARPQNRHLLLTHLDVLPDGLAGEMGVLTAHIARHIEGVANVARAHVYRIGDGGAHLHVWFFARPLGQSQLYGSWLVVWDDLLPEYPDAVAQADAETVADGLSRSYWVGEAQITRGPPNTRSPGRAGLPLPPLRPLDAAAPIEEVADLLGDNHRLLAVLLAPGPTGRHQGRGSNGAPAR